MISISYPQICSSRTYLTMPFDLQAALHSAVCTRMLIHIRILMVYVSSIACSNTQNISLSMFQLPPSPSYSSSYEVDIRSVIALHLSPSSISDYSTSLLASSTSTWAAIQRRPRLFLLFFRDTHVIDNLIISIFGNGTVQLVQHVFAVCG